VYVVGTHDAHGIAALTVGDENAELAMVHASSTVDI